MMTVTIRYGVGNELKKTFPPGTTIGQIISNANVRAVLQYGANVAGHVQGEQMPDATPARDGMTITVNDKACEKQSA